MNNSMTRLSTNLDFNIGTVIYVDLCSNTNISLIEHLKNLKCLQIFDCDPDQYSDIAIIDSPEKLSKASTHLKDGAVVYLTNIKTKNKIPLNFYDLIHKKSLHVRFLSRLEMK